MMTIAENKSLFELLDQNLFDINFVARMLHVDKDMIVEDYMLRFMKGGMKNRLFKNIYSLCEDYVNSQKELELIPTDEEIFSEAA